MVAPFEARGAVPRPSLFDEHAATADASPAATSTAAIRSPRSPTGGEPTGITGPGDGTAPTIRAQGRPRGAGDASIRRCGGGRRTAGRGVQLVLVVGRGSEGRHGSGG